MKHNLYSLLAGLGLACALASNPVAAAPDPADPATERPPLDVTTLPQQELTPQVLFLLLIGEIAGARGEVNVSVDAYLQLARETRDPRIAKRATEIALFARDMSTAATAARMWADADPESEEARRVLAGVLAGGGQQLNEVQIQLARILAGSREQLEQNLLGLNRALARVPDKEVVRRIVERLVEPYESEPAAHFAVAQARAATADGVGALDAIDNALALRPGWEPALAFKAQLLVQLDAVEDAIELLEAHLAQDPDNRNIRLTYARTLVTANDFEGALAEFQRMLDDTPDDRDLMYAVALVSSQLDQLERASTWFERALEAGHPEADGIRMNLGNLAEQRELPEEALRWYRSVGPGQYYFDAQLRVAAIIAQQGDLEAAQAHLHALPVDDDEERKRVLFAEVLLLRNAEQYAYALALVDSALKTQPEDADLLYESGMLAERLDKLDVMEARLRKLIEVDAEHAHALNALGYSLAERGMRLEEAEELIRRALELAPEDPFILDSMGWVRFRRDAPEEALEHLEHAYELRADPEIAAHLGEVLWSLDRRDEANAVWNEALREHPDNDVLKDAVERLRAR